MSPFQQKQLTLIRQMELAFQTNSSASQTVSMQKDYTNDNQLCLAAVSFLPTDLATIIDTQLIKPLQLLNPDQYYFPINGLHLTVQNVRVIASPPSYDNDTIERAKTVFSTIVPHYGAQHFELAGLLNMPTSLAVIALVTKEFNQLVRQLRSELILNDCADNKSYYNDEIIFANITICRYTKIPDKKWFDFIEKIKNKPIGNFNAKTISLIETNAGCHPSKTTIFDTYKFRQN